MRSLKIVLLSIFYNSHSVWAVSPFEAAIQERNGDVYVLINKKFSTSGDPATVSNEQAIYKFQRVVQTKDDVYPREKVGVNNNNLQARIPQYSGLAVDKFGHVKLFRNDGDRQGVSLTTQGAQHPRNATNCNHTTRGCVWIQEPTGRDGWYMFNAPWANIATQKAPFPAGTIFAPLWGPGEVHDPIGSWWGSRLLVDVKKRVRKLYQDTYLSQRDNAFLSNEQRTPGSAFATNLVQGRDFFGNGSSDAFRNGNEAISSTMAFDQSFRQVLGGCGCKDTIFVADVPMFPDNMGRAKYSSGGVSQQRQRTYMVKGTAKVRSDLNNMPAVTNPNAGANNGVTNTVTRDLSNNKAEIVTSVVQIHWDDVREQFVQSDVLIWSRGITPSVAVPPAGNEIAGDGVYNSQLTGTAFGNKRIILYDFNDGKQWAQSVYPSKRVFTGEDQELDKDWLYISNKPESHFNVSANFWGTGGVVWWATDRGEADVQIDFEQHNHLTGKCLNGKCKGNSDPNYRYAPIEARNVQPLVAMGADGENNLYLLHAGGGGNGRRFNVETKEDLSRILQPANAARIQQLIDEGRCFGGPAGCVTFPLNPIAVAAGNYTKVILKVFAGLTLEKISAIPGSKPAKIGVVPLKDTGKKCEVYITFSDPLGTAGTVDESTWLCDEGIENVDISSVLAEYNTEMAVVNVAVPPNTVGDMQLDIVDPAEAIARSGVYEEDKEYTFYMENPPLFNGAIAQLAEAAREPELATYGDQRMLSNYNEPGIRNAKNVMGTFANLYYDNDGKMGTMLPSMIYDDLRPSQTLMTGGPTDPSGFRKTLRFRWAVVARTPPQSMKDFNIRCTQKALKDISKEPPAFDNRGLVHDTCWNDFVDSEPALRDVIVPQPLKFTFKDPGIYDIYFMVAGVRFNADNLSMFDTANSIVAEAVSTWTILTVDVGAKNPGIGDGIQKLQVANNNLENAIEMRASIYPTAEEMEAKLFLGNTASGTNGRFPIYPVANDSAGENKPLVITYEQQHTPIVAEAEVQFFRTHDLKYIGVEDQNQIQTKFRGTGVWDYKYPGGGSLQYQGTAYTPVSKVNSHPSNYKDGNVYKADVKSDAVRRRGYDASGDPETSNGVNTEGTELPRSFENAHQGTLASDQNLPGPWAKDLSKNPHAIYTWWEIKYAWFMRYYKPDGTEVRKVVKTGNLAEVFLLNLMASRAENSGWRQLVRNLAPYHLHGKMGSTWPEGTDQSPLIQTINAQERRYKIRVPLMNAGALLASSDQNEMHSPLKRAFLENESFTTLYSEIHPIAFQTPTEPTVVELSMQLFYPEMDWEARDLKGGTATYYDAVYSGPRSRESGTRQIEDITETTYSFASSAVDFRAWPIMAKTNPISSKIGVDAGFGGRLLGLRLGTEQGGFVSGGGMGNNGESVTYLAPGRGIDDFVDVVVLDIRPPAMFVRTTGDSGWANAPVSLNASTGGRADKGIEILVVDNNPYGFKRSYDDINVTDDSVRSPSLVQFAYEIGADPRNLRGLGLIRSSSNHKAHGFNLSFTNLGASSPDLTDLQSNARNLPQVQVSRATGTDMDGNAYLGNTLPFLTPEFNELYRSGLMDLADSDFLFPGRPLAWPSHGYFLERKAIAQATFSSDHSSYSEAWSRINQGGEPIYYSPHSDLLAQADPQLRVGFDHTVKHAGLKKFLVSLVPESPKAPYGLRNQEHNFPSGVNPWEFVQFVEQKYSQSCLLTPIYQASSKYADAPDSPNSNCEIQTMWRIPANGILAPYFADGGMALQQLLFAKARDARILRPLPPVLDTAFTLVPSNWYKGDFGDWPKHNFSGAWVRRMGEENFGLGLPPAAPVGLAAKISHFTNADEKRRATVIGSMAISDNDAPNFRVILSDSKTRTSVEYTVMGVQSRNINIEEDARQSFFFRSHDPRVDIDPRFKATATNAKLVSEGSGATSYRIVNLADGEPMERVYRIPEDVRFQIKVEATDNRDLDRLSISIQGGIAGYTPSDADMEPATTRSHHFGEINSSADDKRIYKQTKFISAFHLYPNKGVWDQLLVTVRDGAGNSRSIYIPIEVIGQDVFFRQIGSESTRL